MNRAGIKVSDEAVRAATGRDWDEWVAFLDAAGAEGRSHREIVALVGDPGGVESMWWRQNVANGYEKLKGLRTLGMTTQSDFQAGVRRTLPIPASRAWSLVTSPEGVRAWLGAGAALRFEEGETYQLDDGATGEVRVVKPEQSVRLTWRPEGWDKPSTIQVRVEDKGEKSVIAFHEEKLPDAAAREARTAHFKAALDALAALTAG